MILRVWSGCWSYAKGREMSMEWAMGHRSVFHCVARPQPRSDIAGCRLRIAMLEPQFAATSRMVCKSTHLVTLNTQREALSRPPGCRSACSKWWCSCRGLVGKTWIDSRETRQTPAPCSMSNCTAPGPGVQSQRFASGSNLPDGIFSGRSATGDGAALSVENGRRSDGCRPPTQTSSGR